MRQAEEEDLQSQAFLGVEEVVVRQKIHLAQEEVAEAEDLQSQAFPEAEVVVVHQIQAFPVAEAEEVVELQRTQALVEDRRRARASEVVAEAVRHRTCLWGVLNLPVFWDFGSPGWDGLAR